MTKPAPDIDGPALLPVPLRRWLARRLARASGTVPADWVETGIFKVDRLGDFVLALGAIRLLVRHYGGERCVLFVSDKAAGLAAAEFPGVRCVVLPDVTNGVLREWWPMRRRHAPFFDATGFRTVVVLRHWLLPHHRLILAWIKRRQTIALASAPESGSDPFATESAGVPANYPGGIALPLNRELLAHQRVVSQALGRVVRGEELLPRFESIAPVRGDYLLVCPFSSAGIRDYPAAQLAEALRIVDQGSGKTVFSGTDAQRSGLERIARAAGGAHTEVRTGTTTLAFARLVAGARAVLTMDSAAAHMATALDKPAVILLGGGHPGMFGPWGGGRRQHWLTHPLPCYGCDWHCIHAEALCLTRIEPARIAEALREALAAG